VEAGPALDRDRIHGGQPRQTAEQPHLLLITEDFNLVDLLLELVSSRTGPVGQVPDAFPERPDGVVAGADFQSHLVNTFVLVGHLLWIDTDVETGGGLSGPTWQIPWIRAASGGNGGTGRRHSSHRGGQQLLSDSGRAVDPSGELGALVQK
jgi:hypothetical protein